MGSKQNILGLEWLVSEVETSLEEASQALDSYVIDNSQDSQLRFCQGYIHQVTGSLKLSACHGGALLSEAMESVVDMLLGEASDAREDAVKVLKQGLTEVPRYLHLCIESGHDQPALLLNLLNDLRAIRSLPLASSCPFFNPDLAVVRGDQQPHVDIFSAEQQQRREEFTGKLSQAYQYSLLAISKGGYANGDFSQLGKVLQRVKEVTHGSQLVLLWQAAGTVIECLSSGVLAKGPAIQKMLWELGACLRKLSKGGAGAFDDQYPHELLKNFLYYITALDADVSEGLSTDLAANIASLRSEFKLDEALPAGALAYTDDRGLASADAPGYDIKIVKGLVTALGEELADIKSSIDALTNNSDDADLAAESIKSAINRVADTLALIGQTKLWRLVNELDAEIDDILSNIKVVEVERLSSVRARLEDVASALERWAADYQSGAVIQDASSETAYLVDDAQRSLIREVRNNLETVKEAVVGFISSQWDSKFLQDVPALIENIEGAIQVIGMARPVRIIAALGEYIRGELMDKQLQPDWDKLDLLADTITSVEQFMEALDGNTNVDQGALLDVAESAMSALGYFDAVSIQPEEMAAEEVAEHASTDLDDVTVNAVDGGQANGQLDEEILDEEIDAEIVEIFIEEAREILESIDADYPQWLQDRSNNDALSGVRRSFHSLKGSGRMVKAHYIGELGFGIEELFNRVIEGKLDFESRCEELMGVVLEILPTMVDDFEARRANDHGGLIADLIEVAGALVRGEPVTQIPRPSTAADVEQQALDSAVTEPEISEDPHVDMDDELTRIFIQEARGHMGVLGQFVRALKDTSLRDSASDTEILRSMHMLVGSAAVAEVQPVVGIARVLENVVIDITRGILRVDEQILAVFEDVLEALRAMIEQAGGVANVETTSSRDLEHRLEALWASHRVSETQDLEIILFKDMLSTGLQRIFDTPEALQKWQSQSLGPVRLISELTGELRELAESADAAKCQNIAIFAQQFADALEICNGEQCPANKKTFKVFSQAYESLLDMIDGYVSAQPPQDATVQLVSDLQEVANLAESVQRQARTEANADETNLGEQAATVGDDERLVEGASADNVIVNGTSTGEALVDEDIILEITASQITEPEITELEIIDPEIIAIFIDEAEDLLEQIESATQTWRDQPDDNSHYDALIRALHTFKGGARVAGFKHLGDLSHEFETYIEDCGKAAETRSNDFFDELLKRYDQLAAQLESRGQETDEKQDPAEPVLTPPDQIEKSDIVPSASGIDALVAGLGKSEQHQSVSARLKRAASAQVLPIGRRFQAPVKSDQPLGKQSAPAEVQEMVKISASAIDKLVNLAGETNITRGRVEQKIEQFNQSLDEMETTIIRLQSQINRMGTETEAQILFRREQIESSDDSQDFDPLELDRYSHLQHLYGALQESASDLQEVKDTLIGSAKSAELSLAQQSLVTTDLQENLVLTRMVPIARLVPRLRRVVRQVSNELDKPVKFHLENTDGELDRNVLNKIVGPLEHMIRNAVDHGLEDTKTRQANGKPEEGQVSLSFGRESNEIIIRLTDDGKGLNTEAIRARAVSQGLIKDGTHIAEQELLQMIFLPGFSTSDKLSQVSGRGVGLDVVVNEVRELGGVISVSSEPGMGTEFNIRVPFSVAVNRALMIRSKKERYALPLNSIVGVAKMTYPKLIECYEDPTKTLNYGGDDYRVCALSNLLNEPKAEASSAAGDKAALVLVATENYRFAVQVESLEGSQEIVIKGLGAMFNRVAGLTGVTVMGDGGVVVILDLLTLLRAQGGMDLLASDGQLMACEQSNVDYIGTADMPASGASRSMEFAGSEAKTVMVVDDSVTVRKVTTRFLEREGFRVVTAKDGVDAIDLLETVNPTLMLLDIEMPRMDGFDVARVIRNSDNLSTLPIIMISSRSGQKHRDKASSCGVDHFLGKPYREDELLAIITDVLAEKEIA